MVSVQKVFTLAAMTLALAGCGGSSSPGFSSSGAGDGSSSGSASSSGSSSGGSSSSSSSSSGGSSSSSSSSGSAAANVQPVVLDQGPAALRQAGITAVNVVYTSVVVCAPGSTSNCQTIDHVQVDTGSEGLRILSSVLNSQLAAALPQQTSGADPLYECIVFVDGYSWGIVAAADLHVGGSNNDGEVAAGIPVQIIGKGTASAPGSCTSAGKLPAENTVATFGANGILGVGPFVQDCGSYCEQPGVPQYYACPAGANCATASVPAAQQVNNPVSVFTTDNNGVLIVLPALTTVVIAGNTPANGAATVSGQLIFGIGTQDNNGLGAATVLTLDPTYGTFTTTFNGSALVDSYIDSGSNALYLNNSTIAQCGNSSRAPGFFCPAATLAETAVNTGVNGVQSAVSFAIANANTLFTSASNDAAFDALAGSDPVSSTTDPQAFGWGTPFFFGRSVFTAIENSPTPGGTGPYFAY